MNISQNCIDLIKYYEGCRLTSYKIGNDVITIGYGHTNNVKRNQTITQEQAEEFLQQDLRYFVELLNNNLDQDLEQYQFDALISFLFNVGQGCKHVKDGLFTLKNGNPSTLWKDILEKNYEDAAKQFLLWDKAGGKVLKGLQKRRKSESILFSTGNLELF